MKPTAHFLPLFLAASAMFALVPGLASGYTLNIFGNANMDENINEKDDIFFKKSLLL